MVDDDERNRCGNSSEAFSKDMCKCSWYHFYGSSTPRQIESLRPKHRYFGSHLGSLRSYPCLLNLLGSTNWIVENRIEVSQDCYGGEFSEQIANYTYGKIVTEFSFKCLELCQSSSTHGTAINRDCLWMDEVDRCDE